MTATCPLSDVGRSVEFQDGVTRRFKMANEQFGQPLHQRRSEFVVFLAAHEQRGAIERDRTDLDCPRLERPAERREQLGPSQQITSAEFINDRFASMHTTVRLDVNRSFENQVRMKRRLALAQDDFTGLKVDLVRAGTNAGKMIFRQAREKRVLAYLAFDVAHSSSLHGNNAPQTPAGSTDSGDHSPSVATPLSLRRIFWHVPARGRNFPPEKPVMKKTSKPGAAKASRVEHIVVPTDFSAPSLKAIAHAKRMAEAFGARITLLHTIEPVVLPDAAALLSLSDDELATKMRGKLEKLKRDEGLPNAELAVRKGTPFHEICVAAEALGADMLVIATHGYTGLKHVVLGSTAERVVRYAPCPVLVIPARN